MSMLGQIERYEPMWTDIPDGHGPGCQCPECADFRGKLGLYRRLAQIRADREESIHREQRLTALGNAITALDRARAEQSKILEAGTAGCARRSPAFMLAVVGMLTALAVVSQILFYFH